MTRMGPGGVAALAARFPYAISALDRIGLSLFTFALNLALVRVLSATDFGVVSLWMTASFLALDLQSALVTTPLNVHLPATPDAASARRLGGAAASVNLLAAVLIAAAFGVVAALVEGATLRSRAIMAIAVAFYVATSLYREYYRSIAFGRRDMALLLWVDVPYLVVTAACLAAMVVWSRHLAGVAAAFIAMSIGGIVSQSCVHLRAGHEPLALFRRGWVAAYRAVLGDIFWSLVGVVATHVQSRSYIYIATSLVGLAAVATLNIVGVLFRPLRLLVNAWSRPALPNLSELLARGEIAGFDRILGRAFAVAIASSILWYIVLSLAWQPVSHYLLAGKYPGARALLLPCAVAFALWLLESIASIGLLAAKEFKFLANTAIVCGIAAVVATVLLVLSLGYVGAMWGNAVGNGIGVALEIVRLQAVRARLRSSVQRRGAAASASATAK